MADFFTNPDPRLRPQAKLEDYSSVPMTVNGRRISVPTSYKVTPSAFPQLHARFLELQKQAGITPHQLIIREHFARVSRRDGLITIGLSFLNSHSFDDIEFAIGHEIGHGWHEQNPHAKPIIRVPINPAHMPEVLADLFARCLTQNEKAAIRTLQGLGNPDKYHPEPNLRIAAVQQMQPQDCVESFNVSAQPPLSIRASTTVR